MTDFDAYMMVDWGASNKPKRGKDSIWYCMAVRTSSGLCICPPRNPPTRKDALKQIAKLIAENVDRGLFTLVGFDFPYGYPSGFAAALHLKPKNGLPWRQVWNVISRWIRDSQDNRNNRFEVAAQLNKKVSGATYPFWGCPQTIDLSGLSAYKPVGHQAVSLPEKRITEVRARRTQPTWKLFGAGSVGSQALVGIPYIARLRNDAKLSKYSRVWPFETGMRRLPARSNRRWLVVHAEIYPSIVQFNIREHEIRDAVQVCRLAKHFADLDEKGQLSRLFAGPTDLNAEQRKIVKEEEGWILGVLEGA